MSKPKPKRMWTVKKLEPQETPFFEDLMQPETPHGTYCCQHGVPLNKICGKCAGLERPTGGKP